MDYALQVAVRFRESFPYSLTAFISSVLFDQYFVLQLTEELLQ